MQPEESIRDAVAVVTFYGKRLDRLRQNPGGDGDQSGDESLPNVKREQGQRNGGASRSFSLFGPKLSFVSLSAASSLSTSRDQAELDISAFELYHKGYRRSGGDTERTVNDQFNDTLKEKYDSDPRIFWKDPNHNLAMGCRLTEFASYVFSILAGSAGPEREFSRMGYLVSSRRSSYTAANTNMRLTLANLIPQKRRLESELRFRKLIKAKLFHAN